MNGITKEGVTVRIGQVWRDLDKRMGDRTCTVLAIDSDGKKWTAFMRVDGTFARITRVNVARMHKSSTGWKLEKEAP